MYVQPKYTAKAEDKISEARTKPAQGPLNEEASVNRYNAMKAAAAAAVNRWAHVPAHLKFTLLPSQQEHSLHTLCTCLSAI